MLCFTLAACGSSGTGNEDYDYILSLLDKGEYDMAIQVIEMLSKNSSAAAEAPADTAQEAQAESGANTAPGEFIFTSPGEASCDGQPILENGSDFILGNIHKTRSPEAYADYIQAKFGDPPGLIVKYTATEVPAVDSPISQDGSVEVIYAQMNDIDLQILFDDPSDSLTFRFEAAPSRQPDWA